MFCWFLALTMIPFADATIIGFTVPMFLTILAMLILGERIHRYRWSALGLGCAGVVIMIGPHATLASGSLPGVLTGLTAAVFAAFALMFLRSMSGREHAVTITFYFFLTSTACSALTALAGWPMPSREQWFVMALAGFLGVFGQLLMTYSYRYAEASTIAPLEYTSLIVAVAIGYFIFGEIPHLSTWVGAPLVIIAGLIILWREYRLSQAPPTGPGGTSARS
jgi:drug/metabolite transporter (DMT)-like permease